MIMKKLFAFLAAAIIVMLFSHKTGGAGNDISPTNTESTDEFTVRSEYRNDISSELPQYSVTASDRRTLSITSEKLEVRLTTDILKNRITAVTIETNISIPASVSKTPGNQAEALYEKYLLSEFDSRAAEFKDVFMAALYAFPGTLDYVDETLALTAFDAAFSEFMPYFDNTDKKYNKSTKLEAFEVKFILTPSDEILKVSAIIIPLTDDSK